jgi:hypothetical protein
MVNDKKKNKKILEVKDKFKFRFHKNSITK